MRVGGRVEDVSDAELHALGLSDNAQARRMISELAGQGVTDDLVAQLLPSLFNALRKSPDPDRALNNFARWIASVTNRYTHFQLLLSHPVALEIFFNVCGTSQLFADILIRNPEYFEILANPGVRGARPAGAIYGELSAFVDAVVQPELKLEAMRRFKQREFLRIGVRDILGLADMPATSLDFSNLADASVQTCLEIGTSQLEEKYGLGTGAGFAVIALGKLGGKELNYSSDIDLIFVCKDEPLEVSHKLGEFINSALSNNMQNGHLFRVDLRLRPEGRFGTLVRTLESYKTYYESWAEPWELQALLKSRYIAGNVALGRAFEEMIVPYVYRRTLPDGFADEIRANKRKIERKAEKLGESLTNVKTGVGGIRDIEFTVQVLQLELGGRDPAVRNGNTLRALSGLHQAGALSEREAGELSEDYAFLRTVEHRLQILYDLQTQMIPVDTHERTLLARRLGYLNVDEFDDDYRHRTKRVRGHCNRLFYGDRPADAYAATKWESYAAAPDDPELAQALAAWLVDCEFREPDTVVSSSRIHLSGSEYGDARPESRTAFVRLFEKLIASCRRTGDPDAAYRGIESLALATPNRAALYESLNEGEELLDRLCRLGSGSPLLMHALAHHIEWLDLLVSDEIVDPQPPSAIELFTRIATRLGTDRPRRSARAGVTHDKFWSVLAVAIQRERLRIGARDLWGDITTPMVGRELTNLADAVLEIILSHCVEETVRKYGESVRRSLKSMALIGLGKLGGQELGYGSDWDILFVFRENAKSRKLDARRPALECLAELVLSAGQLLHDHGAPVTIDARLRPEGRFGVLVRSVEEYGEYYRKEALTWEQQVLIKARPVAGDAESARAYIHVVHDIIYREAISENDQDDIRRMKRKMESERLKLEDRFSDLKLGHGGMTDIEFLAQLYQLQFGSRFPEVRIQGTIDALHALAGCGVIPVPDAVGLADTYAFITELRNGIALLGDLPADLLPSDNVRLRPIAIRLGILDSQDRPAELVLQDMVEAHLRVTREIVERWLYAPIPTTGKTRRLEN